MILIHSQDPQLVFEDDPVTNRYMIYIYTYMIRKYTTINYTYIIYIYSIYIYIHIHIQYINLLQSTFTLVENTCVCVCNCDMDFRDQQLLKDPHCFASQQQCPAFAPCVRPTAVMLPEAGNHNVFQVGPCINMD